MENYQPKHLKFVYFMTVKLFYIYQISNEILEKYKKKRNNQRIENIRQRFINL